MGILSGKNFKISELTEQANALIGAGNYEAAINIYTEILKTDPDHAETLHSLGLIKYQTGFQEEAISYLRKAISIDAANHYFHNNIAMMHAGIGRMPEALEAIQKALELCPDNPNYHFNAGTLYYEVGDYESAIHYYKTAIARKPDYAEAHNNLGKALQDYGSITEAESAYRSAIKYNPDYAFAHNNLGTVLQDKGDFGGAMSAYEDASRIAPYYALPLSNIAYLKKCGSTEDKILTCIKDLFENDDIPAGDEILLSFALGKLFDDCREYDKAFHNYERGNLLAGLNVNFDINEHKEFITMLKECYSQHYFSNISGSGSDSSVPVFIVGMPRSGTSLVEQIIASHSSAFGAGELDFFNQITGIMAFDKKLIRERIEFWSHSGLKEHTNAASAYLDLLTSFAGGQKLRMVDKMPYNFLHLGLISTLFPNAYIIHCKREPLDTCLSVYFQYFQGFHNYSFDLNNIARYYQSYENIMYYWEELIPNPCMTIKYEDMVGNIEEASRSIIAFLKLPWENACLRFHENKQVVRTRSNIQVRQPVYKSSINRWQNYEKHIKPLLDVFVA